MEPGVCAGSTSFDTCTETLGQLSRATSVPGPALIRSSTNQPLNAGDIRRIISVFSSPPVRLLVHGSCWAVGMTGGAGNHAWPWVTSSALPQIPA